MSTRLQYIFDNYMGDVFSDSSLPTLLEELNDEAMLQVILERLKEVEEEHGKCKLKKIILNSDSMSVLTNHPDDMGADINQSVWKSKGWG